MGKKNRSQNLQQCSSILMRRRKKTVEGRGVQRKRLKKGRSVNGTNNTPSTSFLNAEVNTSRQRKITTAKNTTKNMHDTTINISTDASTPHLVTCVPLLVTSTPKTSLPKLSIPQTGSFLDCSPITNENNNNSATSHAIRKCSLTDVIDLTESIATAQPTVIDLSGDDNTCSNDDIKIITHITPDCNEIQEITIHEDSASKSARSANENSLNKWKSTRTDKIKKNSRLHNRLLQSFKVNKNKNKNKNKSPLKTKVVNSLEHLKPPKKCDKISSKTKQLSVTNAGTSGKPPTTNDRLANVANVGQNVYSDSPVTLPSSGLRPIIIDGSNVAFDHSNHRHFSCIGLQFCINYFKKKGHKVTAFVPQFRVRESQLLKKLVKQGDVVLTPSREVDGRPIVPYDDRYIVQAAVLKGGIIVTRDNYRDLLLENPAWAETIKYRLLQYTWVDDVIMFPNDPLGKDGPSLEEFLRF